MCGSSKGGGGSTYGINPHAGSSRGFNWGGGGIRQPKITGRKHWARKVHDMCIISGGGGGHPHASNRSHYERQVQIGNRKGWLKLESLVGHAFADVLRGRMSLAAWWRFETDLAAHEPGCRYRRIMERVRAAV